MPTGNDVAWEPESEPKHYQATIFASAQALPDAVAAAKDLLPRGFYVRVVSADFLDEAVTLAISNSERIVTVGMRQAEILKSLAVPIVRLDDLSSCHIAEACIRNLS